MHAFNLAHCYCCPIYVLVITQARVLCLIYMHGAQRQVRVYQTKHECLFYNSFYTSGTLKICPNLKENVQLAYIVTDANCSTDQLKLDTHKCDLTYF